MQAGLYPHQRREEMPRSVQGERGWEKWIEVDNSSCGERSQEDTNVLLSWAVSLLN